MRRALAATVIAALAVLGLALFVIGEDTDVPVLKSPSGELRDAAAKARRAAGRERVALPAPPCPSGVAGCSSVAGRVVYVEAVDPDGDGDLHVVVTGGSVTAPGFTAIDVRAGLRPARDPRLGDRAAAAGPVQTGSHQQRQIHALTFSVLPR